jgi:hypothetical protein
MSKISLVTLNETKLELEASFKKICDEYNSKIPTEEGLNELKIACDKILAQYKQTLNAIYSNSF